MEVTEGVLKSKIKNGVETMDMEVTVTLEDIERTVERIYGLKLEKASCPPLGDRIRDLNRELRRLMRLKKKQLRQAQLRLPLEWSEVS